MMQISAVLPDVPVVLPSAGACRPPEGKHCSSFLDAKCFLSPGLTRNCSFANPKLEVGPQKLRTRSIITRAYGNSGGDLIPMAPLQLESPVGQLLAQILQTHPHLLLATAEKQLENLQSQRDIPEETTAPSSQDLFLYKRIAEVKEKERRKTVEEILYCLVVQNFVENNITLIPKISTTSDPAGRVDFWPNQGQKLESVHSPAAFEMIFSHLSHVLAVQVVRPLDTIEQISIIKPGTLYAASIMYGYFLRRVDERYQLERSMNTLPEGFGEEEIITYEERVPEKQLWDLESVIQIYPDKDGGGRNVERPYKLKSYMMYFDAETLDRYATIRSKEARSLIEKQTQALFGRPDIRVAEDCSLGASNDEAVSLTFSGLRMLVLEAAAFGSFLWDAENHAESKYPFINT